MSTFNKVDSSMMKRKRRLQCSHVLCLFNSHESAMIQGDIHSVTH